MSGCDNKTDLFFVIVASSAICAFSINEIKNSTNEIKILTKKINDTEVILEQESKEPENSRQYKLDKIQ